MFGGRRDTGDCPCRFHVSFLDRINRIDRIETHTGYRGLFLSIPDVARPPRPCCKGGGALATPDRAGFPRNLTGTVPG